jgi:hypothetical protein
MTVRPLFLDGDLSATLDARLTKAKRAVDEFPEAKFRSTDPTALATQFLRQFRVEPVTVTEGAVSVEAHDAAIDRRKISNIDFAFPGDPTTVPGTRVVYNVPFTGDAALFRLKPPTWTTVVPHAILAKTELRFVYEVASAQVAATKQSFERDLSLTKQWLGWGNEAVTRFNATVAAAIVERVNQRAARLDAASEGLASLGLPIRQVRSTTVDALLVPTDVALSRSGRPPAHPYDVALSFAGEDRPYVHEVAEHLKNAGARVFYDEFEMVALWGKDLVEHLQSIYQNQARFCVLFISKHYVDKPWPTHERRSAQARALVAKEEYLLPARFDDSEVPGLPPTIGFVDLRTLAPNEFGDLVLGKVGVRRIES